MDWSYFCYLVGADALASVAVAKLAAYIQDALLQGKNAHAYWKSGSEMLHDKLGFIEKVIAVTETEEDVSPEARNLFTKLIDFILDNNPSTASQA